MQDEDEMDPRSEAEYAAAAEWAEHRAVLPERSSTAVRGAAAAASGRGLLERALGGADAVEEALRGRPKLDAGSPVGQHARQRQVRLPAELDAALESLAHRQERRVSDVLRDALSDYVHAHPTAG